MKPINWNVFIINFAFALVISASCFVIAMTFWRANKLDAPVCKSFREVPVTMYMVKGVGVSKTPVEGAVAIPTTETVCIK
jgi:hypothetical protein